MRDTHTFNSLFEILSMAMSMPKVSFSKSFNSLFEIPKTCMWLERGGKSPLSILFLRFREEVPRDGEGRAIHFQFSFWDSWRGEWAILRPAPSASFQFSFWDSSAWFMALGGARRSTFNSLFEIQTISSALSSMRLSSSFNSLFEIQGLDSVHGVEAESIFQFSFWDSWLNYEPPKWGRNKKSFNSLFEIPCCFSPF